MKSWIILLLMMTGAGQKADVSDQVAPTPCPTPSSSPTKNQSNNSLEDLAKETSEGGYSLKNLSEFVQKTAEAKSAAQEKTSMPESKIRLVKRIGNMTLVYSSDDDSENVTK